MTFNILVCVKQVPDSDKVKIDPATGTLIRKGVPGILNSDDNNALESALQIKDKYPNAHVVAVTMGPPQAREVLFEAISKGADEGILINDPAVASSDTLATSLVLASAIEKWANENGGYSLILAGREATDGDTAQVGPQVAERLDIAQVTYTSDISLSDDMTTLDIIRKLGDCQEVVQVEAPCLITATKELNIPRYPHMARIFEQKKITQWNIDDLGIDSAQVGLEGSNSVIMSSFTMKKAKGGLFINGETGEEQAINLLSTLKSDHII